MSARVNRLVNADTGEVQLYCHSAQRETQDRGIDELFAKRFEVALDKLARGLHKTRCFAVSNPSSVYARCFIRRPIA